MTTDERLALRGAMTGDGLLAEAMERQLADAQHQVRHGSDGAKRVPTWQRLNAYWWLRKGRGSTERAVTTGMTKTTSWPTFMRETHARLYTGDRIKGVDEVKPEFKFAEKLHSLLDDLPEWERLARRCKGDAFNAESAATGLVSRMMEHVPEHKKDARDARRRAGLLQDEYEEALRNNPGLSKPSQLQGAEQELESAEAEASGNAESMDPSAIRQAMRSAIKGESEHLDEMDRAAMSLGWGAQDAGAGADSMSEAKEAIASRLADAPKLQAIMEIAGRMRNIMREVQATKVRRGVNEVTDIEVGRDIARLLPSELMQLCNPLTKLDLFRKLLEGRALQYKLEAEEKLGKGPVLVVIDDSGSMRGELEVWAKAIGLAMLDLARREGRHFGYCTFSTEVTHSFTEDPGKRTRPGDLLDHLAVHRGGGTSFDAPLHWALGQIDLHPNLDESDIIFISDGACRASDSVVDLLTKSEARCWGVAVGGAAISSTGTGTMAAFCDKVYPVTDLIPSAGNEQESAAARGVLGV